MVRQVCTAGGPVPLGGDEAYMTRALLAGDRMYEISDDKSRIDVPQVHAYLTHESYWAKGRSLDVVIQSIHDSYCIASYDETGSLVAFARVITDWATVYYICDLFVLEQHRRRGIGKELVRTIVEHPRLESLSGMLLTADAHGLYRQFGFTQDDQTRARFMRRPRTVLADSR